MVIENVVLVTFLEKMGLLIDHVHSGPFCRHGGTGQQTERDGTTNRKTQRSSQGTEGQEF